MTYVIVSKPGAENALLKVDNKQEALQVVANIVDGLNRVLNPLYLTIAKKEDDTIVRYDDQTAAVIQIREDDEVDVSITNGQ